MNSRFIKVFIMLVSSLMAQAVLSNTIESLVGYASVDDVAESSEDRYALPSDKTRIESCQQEALFLHPGIVDKQQILHRHGDFLARDQIYLRDGSEWLVLCDLATGDIIRQQKLIDDVY